MFFTPQLVKAFKTLRVHQENGCLGDPHPQDIPLFYLAGCTKDELDKHRSARTTNRVGSYLESLRLLIGAYQTFPRLAHVTMMLHNHRRNLRMVDVSTSIQVISV